MAEYPSNSFKSKEEQASKRTSETTLPAKEIKKVVTGKVKIRENKGRKFADIFISEDAANVKSYIFMDVLVPAIKKAVSDIVTDGIDMILYGSKGGGRSSRTSSGNRIQYSNYYDDRRERDRYRENERSAGNRFVLEDIVYDSRVEAEGVLSQMIDILKRYGVVTVADMYEMSNERIPYTGNDYGWMNLDHANVKRVRDGWIIDLPKASPID